MKKINNKKIFSLIIILLIFVALIYIYYSSNNKNDNQQPQSFITTIPENTDTQSNSDEVSYTGTIYYSQEENDVYNIYSKKPNSEPTLIFTDKDEQQKIQFASSISANLNILTYLQSKEQMFGGSLYLIKADGSGEKELISEDFVSNQAPVISPDESMIAYVLFSNVEFNYGFSLYTMTKNSQNKTKIDTDSTKISDMVFSPDSSKIAYLKNNTLVITNLTDNQSKNIYELKNENLIGLKWDGKDLIATISNDNTTSIAYFQNNELEKFIELKQILSSPCTWADNNQDQIFCVLDNKLILINNKDDQTEIINASQIIQWIK